MPTSRAPRRKKYQVPALKRAFAILDGLNHTSFGLTVQEVSQQHKIPYSTAFYLLETMRECGYAERSADSKKYRLGHKTLSFRESNAARYLLDLRTIARPVMEELTELSDLTTHLAILEREGRGVAAPIFDEQGKVIASLGVAGSLSQIEFDRFDAIGKLVRNYAGQISERLGHGHSVQPQSEPVAS